MREPKTHAEWQRVVTLAEAYLQLDNARQYGLIAGGPTVRVGRCEALLRRGKARGIEPRAGDVERAIAVLVRAQVTP